MIDSSLDDSAMRSFGLRLGAVARVDAVSRPPLAPPVDPARWTDPRWGAFPRPEPAAIAIADIAQFRALVYGSDPWREPAASALATSAIPPALDAPVTPADRIVGTLQHLRGVHGL